MISADEFNKRYYQPVLAGRTMDRLQDYRSQGRDYGAGGKRQLLPALRQFVPARFTAYTEAFLGSGALFFDLAAQGRLNGVPATLIDSNADLVGVYTALAREPAQVILVHWWRWSLPGCC